MVPDKVQILQRNIIRWQFVGDNGICGKLFFKSLRINLNAAFLFLRG